jgi:NADH-quinone oxidoreductase subunit N
MTLPTPSIQYFLLSPTLIVFGIAVVGVLAEAFLPRRMRYSGQVTLALGGLIAAFVAVIAVSRSIASSGRAAVLGAMAIDRPTLYLQGTVLLVAVMAVIFMAERTQTKTESKVSVGAGAGGSGGLDSFTPQASSVPDSDAERDAERAGAAQTELFPLAMLSVGGMMVFPASNDLLTMFVALEVLS